MSELDRINCQGLSFSPELSTKRLDKAKLLFGEKVLKRIIIYCLYLLGVKRADISRLLRIPENTVRTMLRTISINGFFAFIDKRKKTLAIIEKKEPTPIGENGVAITELTDKYNIAINGIDICVASKNKQQLRALLLTLSENGLISKTKAGKLLGISSSHVGHLIKNISENDLDCLIDKRCGQQRDYVFTPEIKSELIVQFAVNAATGEPTSSSVLARDIEKRTLNKLSERSVRFQINSLGLKDKASLLWELVGLKKTS